MDYGYYYDRNGQPITNAEWVASFTDDNKRVRLTELGDVKVSTVWLGIDHQYGDGPPLIFETMIFGGEYDDEMWRYSTEDEAIAGHERAVALVEGETHGNHSVG